MPNAGQMKELLLQSLEHEKGGVQVYQTALECARNKDLKKEWTKYFEQTQTHVKVLTDACQQLDIDPDEVTPGRQIVKHNGAGLVKAMKMALAAGSSAGAELVACECVVIAETKDHFDWELIGQCAKASSGAAKQILQAAYDQVEDEEDEHL
jgi:rubrerythrin